MSLSHRPFLPGTSPLESTVTPPLRLQVSDCSTFCIMCGVPSMAVFCNECIQSFPGMASEFFFKPFVTTPVAQIIGGTIIHFMFHIHCISIHKLLHLSFMPSFV
jgi:hypothetical protein